jgi:hypothetical protein
MTLTYQRTYEEAKVSYKSEVAESSGLCVFCTIFTEHSSHGNNCTGKHTSKTPRGDHLPQRLAHAKQGSGD